MIKEISYQREAVNELTHKTTTLLEENGNRKKIVFKAPTGAGKTVMMSMLLDELTSQLANENKEVSFIWIAPNKLHLQSYLKMKNYFSETRSLRPVMFDELDHSGSDSYIHPGEVLFVNWESINKDSNVMVRESESSASLYEICSNTKEEHGLPLIVIIDEEHMFGGRLAKQSEKVLKGIEAKLEIRVSATPITANPDAMVSISRERVIREEMIKDGITINPIISTNYEGEGSNEFLLDQALKKRIELKEAYEALGIRINPLLLIQLPNDNSEAIDADDSTVIEMVKARLSEKHGINTDNGKLAVWLSSEKHNLDGIENDYNLTEVLLFKQAIALGWDCPRASVLLIFRKLTSTTFTVQTVGRILRMPEQKYYPNHSLNHGWVYTNLSREQIEIVQDDMSYISKGLTAKRRDPLTNVHLPSVYCERLSADRNRLGPDFYPVLVNAFNIKWFKVPIQLQLFSPFEDEGIPSIDETLIDPLEYRKKATLVAGIDFENHGIQIQLLKDVEISGDVGTYELGEKSRIKIAKNQAELLTELDKFCQSLLSGYEKISVTTLRGYIYQFMEEYFSIFESDVPRIILYFRNKPKFAEVLALAIKQYTEKIKARRAAAKSRSFKEYIWEVPELREYNENANSVIPDVKNHALLPFVRLNSASNPEKRFEQFLESNKEYIDWWYKNGDEGKQHYSIPYTTAGGTKASFFIDFVIRMKNGQVFLFDTKSCGSDPEAPNKHNAFIQYVNDKKNARLNLLGGVLIEESGNWYWSKMQIDNTDNIIAMGWDAFHPDRYKGE